MSCFCFLCLLLFTTADKNQLTKKILDVKWIGYDEIMNKMDDELRGSYVKTAVYNKKNNLIAPIEIVDVLND